MAISFYDLSVPTFLQTVSAIAGFLNRAARHCAETSADPDDFVHARLIDDMAPFHFQIEAAWHHAVWGLEAVRTGEFTPPALIGPAPFSDLQAMISAAASTLGALSPEEVDSWAGKDLELRIGPRRLPSPRRPSSSHFRYPTFIFMPLPPTTSCAHAACRLGSTTTKDDCGRVRSSSRRTTRSDFCMGLNWHGGVGPNAENSRAAQWEGVYRR